MASQPVKLLTVLRRSVSIVNAPTTCFLDSVLFLLPLAFFLSTILYPAIFDFYTNPFSTAAISNHLFLTAPATSSELHQSKLTITDLTVFTFITFLSSLWKVGSLTYTAFHRFHAQPVKLYSVMWSLAFVVVVVEPSWGFGALI